MLKEPEKNTSLVTELHSRAIGFTRHMGKAGGAGGRRALLTEREVPSQPLSLTSPQQVAKQVRRVNQSAMMMMMILLREEDERDMLLRRKALIA